MGVGFVLVRSGLEPELSIAVAIDAHMSSRPFNLLYQG